MPIVTGMHAWRRICCPIDFSDASRRALQHATHLAGALGAELTLVHVRAPSGPEREQELTAWAHEAEWKLNREVVFTIRAGEPVDEIVKLTREAPLDVLVLGIRGVVGVGSTVELVVRRASCPVVLVPGA